MSKTEACDTLSILALKCAANIFDISTGLVHVSIRDQIVRANLLIRDITTLENMPPEILVIGAGIAGVTAAVEAAKKGIKVTIIETNKDPFSLQATSKHRFIGPYMYEWPAMFHEPQDYPPLNWPRRPSFSWSDRVNWRSGEPMNAAVFASEQTEWLKNILINWKVSVSSNTAPPLLLTNVSAKLATTLVKAFLDKSNKKSLALQIKGTSWPDQDKKVLSIDPKYIILAASMGPEKVKFGDYEGPQFWEPDNLHKNNQDKIAILGGGDGALQDFLRASTKFEHPLQFIRFLNGDQQVFTLIEKEHDYLLSIEQNSRLNATWTTDNQVYKELDKLCRDVAKNLAKNYSVRRRVSEGLRDKIITTNKFEDSVHLFVRECFFGKTYLLNRFLVHLINECIRSSPIDYSNKRLVRVHFDHQVQDNGYSAKKVDGFHHLTIIHNNSTVSDLFTNLIVKFGVDSKMSTGYKLVGLVNKANAARTNLAQIPLPLYYE